MKLICAYCNETIEDNGMVYKGKAYHTVCFTSFKIKEDAGRISTLSQTFNEINYEVLKELFKPYNDKATGLKMLMEKMNGNWCVIMDLGEDDIRIDRFNTKKDMLSYLTDEIETALLEGYCLEVLYILKKGKLIKSINQYEIKIKLI